MLDRADDGMILANVPLKYARRFVDDWHRHSVVPAGGKLAQAAVDHDGTVLAVSIVGRPVAQPFDDGYRWELLRLCARPGHANACSFLYAAAGRLAVALDLEDLCTYTRADEDGASLRAAGWHPESTVRGRSWRSPSRPREDRDERVDRVRWHAHGFPRDRGRPRVDLSTTSATRQQLELGPMPSG